jgi:hypothetical protein
VKCRFHSASERTFICKVKVDQLHGMWRGVLLGQDIHFLSQDRITVKTKLICLWDPNHTSLITNIFHYFHIYRCRITVHAYCITDLMSAIRPTNEANLSYRERSEFCLGNVVLFEVSLTVTRLIPIFCLEGVQCTPCVFIHVSIVS